MSRNPDETCTKDIHVNVHNNNNEGTEEESVLPSVLVESPKYLHCRCRRHRPLVVGSDPRRDS